jgi:hypothetical protein
MTTTNVWNTPDLTTDGQLMIGRTGNRPVAAVPTGDPNEIDITTGPGGLAIGIADNPVLPGNASFTIPAGNTSSQPSPVNGMMRYDTLTNRLRAVQNSAWTDVITSSSGKNVQQVRAIINAMTKYTSVAAIPRDNTIPQNTEGAQIISATITPANASNILLFQAAITGAIDLSGNNNVEICLFQDSNPNALAVQMYDLRATSCEGSIFPNFVYFMVAGTTSSTTFKLRLGGQTVSQFTINGSQNTPYYGGVMESNFIITEIQV